ncbi:xanthine dehydrogenase rosy [Oratosquilla oratoria]|uniref:xanthine dehydrogenase rosy n=1 Tax=Oratosquilla oratoria TaxID=337810 RepID=UPI003F76932F
MPETCDGQKTLVFFVNGKKIEDDAVDPEWTLLTYLRNKLGLVGTKLGCGEGGCGACTVMVSKYDRHADHVRHSSINACLAPVTSVHGMAVTTVEGIGSSRTRLHAVQERIARAHGSQCGFCTPGIVMSMYTLLRNNPLPSMHDLSEYFTGNLCRCTGYRPILEGFRTFTKEAQQEQQPQGCGRKDCCKLNGKPPKGYGSNGYREFNTYHDPHGEPQMNGHARTNGVHPQRTTSDRKTNHIEENGVGENGVGENGVDENGLGGLEDDMEVREVLFDPSLFRPYDPSQEVIFPPELKLSPELDNQFLEIRGPRVTFYRPTTLHHLLAIKRLHPNAKIIVGNTEVGVEVKFKNQLYPVLVNPCSIAELTQIDVDSKGITFGASVTLSRLEETLREFVQDEPEFKCRTFVAILEMLRWFAGKQIRNAAAIGGNIMTGSPISDLNPLLMASGAQLTLRSLEGERVVPMDGSFFTAYRRNIVRPDEVLVSVHIPYTHEDEYLFGYKQARRRDDDIAIVNAGLRVAFHSGTHVVRDLALAFGGMAPTTVMAPKTQEALLGKSWDEDLMDKATPLLLEDLPLAPSAPGGMIQYRRALTLSFFLKFFLSVKGRLNQKLPNVVPPLTASEEAATQVHKEEPFMSTQFIQKVSEHQPAIDPIGRPMAHTTAMQQATGEATYVDDIPRLHNELYGAFVLSTRAHARILAIDESRAMKEAGVERFISARDIPKECNTTSAISKDDEEIFASEKVIFVGQVVGVVLAKDQQTAQRAAKLVQITYEDIKPCIVTIQDAIREKSWWEPTNLKKGNMEAGLKEAAHVIEGELHMGGQEHFYLETNVTLAVPKENNEMEVFGSTQNPSMVQDVTAKALGVPANRVVVRVKRLGGGFGGKETRTIAQSLPITVAAKIVGRPVRNMLDRDEDMLMTGTRHPYFVKWKVGTTDEGLITAVKMEFYSNCGSSLDLSLGVAHRTLFSCDNCYRWPNVDLTIFPCRTNLSSNTAFRGFGGPQGLLACEDMMARIAATLDLSPLQVRERNMYKTGDLTHFNQELTSFTGRRCWDQVLSQSNYHTRRQSVDQFNKSNTYRKRGLAVVPTKFGISFTVLHLNQAGALVLVYRDGSVLLTHGGTEMGQGLHIKMQQVAARVLELPIEAIYINETSTDKVPNTSPTAASASSDLNGMAVLNACKKIKQRLEPFQAANPKGKWRDWVQAAYFARVSLSATGFYKTPNIYPYNFEKNEGTPFSYFCYGAAVSEVEVDCLTGDHKTLRTDIVMDVGDSLNPAIDIGQVEGAFVQGLGLYTLEEHRYSPTGILYTRGPGAYKIPGFQDIPNKFNVALLREATNPHAVFSSKAVGEPPLFLASSVYFAIRDAVSDCRRMRGLDQTFRFDSPATAERIRLACQDDLTSQVPEAEPGSYKPWAVTV